MNIGSVKLAKFGKATATTVYLMTAVKATVRPAFNLADKKSDEKSRKYSAVNEFLYQMVCIGMAAALIPLLERVGFKLAQKQLAKMDGFKGIKKIGDIQGLEKIKKLGDLKKAYLEKSFDEKHIDEINKIKDLAKKDVKLTSEQEQIKKADEALHFVQGGVETGSFIASILGLTIIAPKLGHEILHPIMEKLGMKNDKKKDDIGTPQELYLADRKIPEEKSGKLNTNA